MATVGSLDVTLRAARLEAGLSQGELAAQAGVTRQSISAIETGKVSPTIEIVLRLARALNKPVDALFRLVDTFPLPADAVVGEPVTTAPVRAQVARVGGRVVARSLAGSAGILSSLPRANGLLRRHPQGQGSLWVDLFAEPSQLDRTLLMTGCDPAIALLADHFQRVHPSLQLAWQNANSTDALRAVGCGQAHIAGSHLADPTGDGFNVHYARQYVAADVVLVAFSDWEQGLAVSPGNPLAITGIADFERPALRLINREVGSGARALLDEGLQRAGLETAEIPGYELVVHSHLATAEAVAAGLADAAVTVRSVAQALGLDFIPLVRERYDLVIPAAFIELPAIQALLDLLKSPLFRREVEALSGYDVDMMGEVTHVAL